MENRTRPYAYTFRAVSIVLGFALMMALDVAL